MAQNQKRGWHLPAPLLVEGERYGEMLVALITNVSGINATVGVTGFEEDGRCDPIAGAGVAIPLIVHALVGQGVNTTRGRTKFNQISGRCQRTERIAASAVGHGGAQNAVNTAVVIGILADVDIDASQATFPGILDAISVTVTPDPIADTVGGHARSGRGRRCTGSGCRWGAGGSGDISGKGQGEHLNVADHAQGVILAIGDGAEGIEARRRLPRRCVAGRVTIGSKVFHNGRAIHRHRNALQQASRRQIQIKRGRQGR